MGFSRTIAPVPIDSAGDLSAALAAIGMNLAVAPARDANIEDTLYHASIEGMEHGDLRILALLVTWFGVHSRWVNADRLIAVVDQAKSPRVRAFWSALATWQGKDRRFARLVQTYKGPRVNVQAAGSDFQIKRHGEDPRFAGSALRVAANVLRDRAADVLPPAELAARNPRYRARVQIGPTYRADMWALLENDPALSAAELARRAHGSFATAWQVRKDFFVLHSADRGEVPRGHAGK
jgi:hypothetical protein